MNILLFIAKIICYPIMLLIVWLRLIAIYYNSNIKEVEFAFALFICSFKIAWEMMDCSDDI